jgi:adenylate cyclase class 2
LRENLRKTPDMEVEIKLRVADRSAMLRRLKRLKAKGGERLHEMNTLYDIPGGALAREGKLLRIRVERPAPARGGKPPRKARSSNPAHTAVLTYKGPVQAGAGTEAGFHGRRYKIREEHEARVEDAAALGRVFEGLGLRPWFRYEKYRSTYRLPGLPGLLVDLDETPIGDFLELEGAREAIDRCALLLGFGPRDYIVKGYGALYLEQRRSSISSGSIVDEPVAHKVLPDMLFGLRDKPARSSNREDSN